MAVISQLEILKLLLSRNVFTLSIRSPSGSSKPKRATIVDSDANHANIGGHTGNIRKTKEKYLRVVLI